MTINSIPIDSILGGILIGVAASLLFVLLGKIAGISGITWQLLATPFKGNTWRYLFIIGLISGAGFAHSVFAIPIPETATSNPIVVIMSGLLVGFGVKFGSGCTSGHGICGLARLSKRSIVATLCFMVSGFTVATLKYLLIN